MLNSKPHYKNTIFRLEMGELLSEHFTIRDENGET